MMLSAEVKREMDELEELKVAKEDGERQNGS